MGSPAGALIEEQSSLSALSVERKPETFDDAAQDDIDQALAKAGRFLDDGAYRLDRLADEIRHETSSVDNSSTSTDVQDNPLDNSARPLAVQAEPHQIISSILEARAARKTEMIAWVVADVGRHQSDSVGVPVVAALLEADATVEAELLLDAVGRLRAPAGVPPLLAALRVAGHDPKTHRIFASAGLTRPPHEFLALLTELRSSGQEADAYQVLAAAGRLQAKDTLPALLGALDQAGQHGDVDWILQTIKKERASQTAAFAMALEKFGQRYAAAALIPLLSRELPENDLGLPVYGAWPEDAPFAGLPAAQTRRTETTLTTRIRINIPGSRPIPPVVLRLPAGDPDGTAGEESRAHSWFVRTKGRPGPQTPQESTPDPGA
jgi:hypothetical protein